MSSVQVTRQLRIFNAQFGKIRPEAIHFIIPMVTTGRLTIRWDVIANVTEVQLPSRLWRGSARISLLWAAVARWLGAVEWAAGREGRREAVGFGLWDGGDRRVAGMLTKAGEQPVEYASLVGGVYFFFESAKPDTEKFW